MAAATGKSIVWIAGLAALASLLYVVVWHGGWITSWITLGALVILAAITSPIWIVIAIRDGWIELPKFKKRQNGKDDPPPSTHGSGSSERPGERYRHFDPAKTLTAYAKQLNAICSPGQCPTVSYEIMSGALVWSDETNGNLPAEVFGALRFIVAYRTSLMLNKPREELKQMWDLGLSLFPEWVGFRPERREPSANLLQIYRRGNVGLRKCLRDLEREMDKENAERSATADGTPDLGS